MIPGEMTSRDYLASFRGKGWQAECVKCVGSRFVCDEHRGAMAGVSECAGERIADGGEARYHVEENTPTPNPQRAKDAGGQG